MIHMKQEERPQQRSRRVLVHIHACTKCMNMYCVQLEVSRDVEMKGTFLPANTFVKQTLEKPKNQVYQKIEASQLTC